MFLEEFLKSEGKLARLNQALSILSEIGFFEVMMELSYKRSGDIVKENILEASTLQRGYSLGYYESIEDMYHFRDKFALPKNKITSVPDWGASKLLMSKEGWTAKEVEDARNKWSDSRKS